MNEMTSAKTWAALAAWVEGLDLSTENKKQGYKRIHDYAAACVAEALADPLAQARLIAEECLADIDMTFRLNVDMRDHTVQVCLQAQKNGVRFVLKRLIERSTRAEALALLAGEGTDSDVVDVPMSEYNRWG